MAVKQITTEPRTIYLRSETSASWIEFRYGRHPSEELLRELRKRNINLPRHARIGDHVHIGNWVEVEGRAFIGDGVVINDWACIGKCARIGNNSIIGTASLIESHCVVVRETVVPDGGHLYGGARRDDKKKLVR